MGTITLRIRSPQRRLRNPRRKRREHTEQKIEKARQKSVPIEHAECHGKTKKQTDRRRCTETRYRRQRQNHTARLQHANRNKADTQHRAQL